MDGSGLQILSRLVIPGAVLSLLNGCNVARHRNECRKAQWYAMCGMACIVEAYISSLRVSENSVNFFSFWVLLLSRVDWAKVKSRGALEYVVTEGRLSFFSFPAFRHQLSAGVAKYAAWASSTLEKVIEIFAA